MKKKEREQLKERFMNLVVDDKREKITVKDLTATAMMIRSTPPDYPVLLNFIEKELDKAREEVQFTKEELECILKWKDACDGEFNGMTLLPASGEDWGKEEDIENAEDKLEEMLSKLKDNK